MDDLQKMSMQPDEWQGLKAFTDARIALGSTGSSLPIKAVLELRLAGAQAKDAVYSLLDADHIKEVLEGVTVYCVKSKAPDRDMYLQRPDLGRVLDEASHQYLTALTTAPSNISIIIADGLSATAVNTYASLFVSDFLKLAMVKGYTLAPVIIATMARVAIADEIGYLLNARLTIILIGERPGLSASDSMGAYITYGPMPGTTDEKRNCVSNIRNKGLPPQLAAEKVMHIVEQGFQLQLTGVHLKDDQPFLLKH